MTSVEKKLSIKRVIPFLTIHLLVALPIFLQPGGHALEYDRMAEARYEFGAATN